MSYRWRFILCTSTPSMPGKMMMTPKKLKMTTTAAWQLINHWMSLSVIAIIINAGIRGICQSWNLKRISNTKKRLYECRSLAKPNKTVALLCMLESSVGGHDVTSACITLLYEKDLGSSAQVPEMNQNWFWPLFTTPQEWLEIKS